MFRKHTMLTSVIVILAILLGMLGVLLFAGFVWPSRYQYRKMDLNILGQQEIRVDRFTEEAQLCGDGRWQRIEIAPDNDGITLPAGTKLTFGDKGNKCPRIPWSITAVLAGVVIGEVGLVFLLVFVIKSKMIVKEEVQQ